MEVFLSLILLVFGILQIILFFKIWEMTNDVKDMKNKMLGSYTEDTEFLIRKNRAIGNNEKVAEILIEELLCSFEKYINSAEYYASTDLSENIAELEKKLQVLGVELPSGLRKIKNAKDFKDLSRIRVPKEEKK